MAAIMHMRIAEESRYMTTALTVTEHGKRYTVTNFYTLSYTSYDSRNKMAIDAIDKFNEYNYKRKNEINFTLIFKTRLDFLYVRSDPL